MSRFRDDVARLQFAAGARHILKQRVCSTCTLREVAALANDPSRAACHCVVGAGIGVLTGSLAVGDTMLMILYLIASGCEQRLAVGTTLLACSLPYLLTVVVHLGRGSAVPVLIPASMFSMCIGSCLGAQVSCHSLSNEQLQIGLAGGALMVGLLTARDVLRTL